MIKDIRDWPIPPRIREPRRDTVPWPQIRALAADDLESLLTLLNGTGTLTLQLDFRGGELVKASAGAKLSGRRG